MRCTISTCLHSDWHIGTSLFTIPLCLMKQNGRDASSVAFQYCLSIFSTVDHYGPGKYIASEMTVGKDEVTMRVI